VNGRVEVKSHISRDFLQNAAYFNTLPKVIWEYVSNSLDNGKEGIPTTVIVQINKDEGIITIADNGTGMTRSDLERFFTMHGENIQRLKGKKVRGRFGTGKSAAFGIARQLEIETRKGKKVNVVSLNIDDIKKASSGEPFFVNDLVIDQITQDDDGTIVTIKELIISKFEIENTITFIEKHLARYHIKASVIINGHECKFKEPPSVCEYKIRAPFEIEHFIGTPDLIIKVAPFSLGPDEKGIDILSDGIWHETTLGDVDGRELSDRLFGEIEVPLLEKAEDDITPFDNTRNNLLNRANSRVVVLIAWISQELEKVRAELLKKEKEKKKSEQAQRLHVEAQRMAHILNDDFNKLMDELELSKKITEKRKTKVDEVNTNTGEILPGDGDLLSQWQQSGQPHGDGTRGNNPPGEGDVPRNGPSLIPGDSLGAPKQIIDGKKKNRSGLFSIEFDNLTEDHERSSYKANEHVILINLDHPQVAFALKESGGSLDSIHFLSTVYEIATVAYAQTIPFERMLQGDQVDVGDALFSVSDTIDRITRKFSKILNNSL
jgi:hypothetical protein